MQRYTGFQRIRLISCPQNDVISFPSPPDLGARNARSIDSPKWPWQQWNARPKKLQKKLQMWWQWTEQKTLTDSFERKKRKSLKSKCNRFNIHISEKCVQINMYKYMWYQSQEQPDIKVLFNNLGSVRLSEMSKYYVKQIYIIIHGYTLTCHPCSPAQHIRLGVPPKCPRGHDVKQNWLPVHDASEFEQVWALHVGVSKNRCTPKWMMKIMENPIKMDDLGVPLFLETPMYTEVFLSDQSTFSLQRVSVTVWDTTWAESMSRIQT